MKKMCWLLSVGVSTQDEGALQFLYENNEDFSPLPTFCVVPAQAVMMGGALWSNIPGWSVDLTKVLICIDIVIGQQFDHFDSENSNIL